MNLAVWHRSGWVLLAFFLACCTDARSDITLFSADMQAATVTTDTSAANLNAGTATGTWTDSAGRSPSDIDIVQDGAAKAVLADQDSGSPWAPFDLNAALVSSAGLQDVVEIEFDTYIRRVPAGDHTKDIHIVGLDNSSNESFHLQLSAANSALAGELRRVGYIHSGGTGPVWNLPGAADADNDLVYDWNAFASSKLRGIKIHMSGSQYKISFDRDNDGTYDETGEWTTDWLDFNGSATAISRVRIYGQNSTSGFFFDNVVARIVTGPPTVNTGAGAVALDATRATLHGKVASTNGLPLQAVRIYLGDDNAGESYNWDTNYVFNPGSIEAGVAFSNTFSGLLYDVPYSYCVYASNSAGEVWSEVETFTTPPLVAPTFTIAESSSWSTMSLQWQDNAPRESHYVLRRSPSGDNGSYSVIATLGSNTTSYVDTLLAPASTYFYQLSASNSVDGRFSAFTECETNAATVAFTPASRILSANHVVSGTVTGYLIPIDVPYADDAAPAVSGGPIWTSDPAWGATASPADNGFVTVNNPINELDGTSNWEPDGTPLSEAKAYRTSGSATTPSVKYVFNLTSSWINIPDGAVINAVYATWLNTRINDGCTYSYTEGSQSVSIVRQTGKAAPIANLVLRWTDSANTTHNGNFERIFSGPIVVEGGNGFEVWATDNAGNAAHLDAVVIDISFPIIGSVFRFR